MKKLILAAGVAVILSGCGSSQHGDPRPDGVITPQNYLRLSNGEALKFGYGQGTMTAKKADGNNLDGKYYVAGHSGRFSYNFTEVSHVQNGIVGHVGGIDTPVNAIPNQGTAHYTGSLYANNIGPVKEDSLGADIQNDGVRAGGFRGVADFGTKTFTGTGYMVPANNPNTGPGNPTGKNGEDFIPSRQYDFKSNITGNKFAGTGTIRDLLIKNDGTSTITNPDANAKVNSTSVMDVRGGFYGPNYEEVAGLIKSAQYPQADATFGAARQ